MRDSNRAAEMGRKGRAFAETEFNWERETGRLVEIYKGLFRDIARKSA